MYWIVYLEDVVVVAKDLEGRKIDLVIVIKKTLI